MADYTLTAKLTADAKGFQAGFEKAQASLANMQDKILSTGQSMQQAGKKMMATGTKLSLGVTTPLVMLGKSAIDTGMAFDDAMAQVAAVSGSTGKDLEALRNKAKEMGKTTKFSASESADAFNFMAMAGWDTTQMLDGIDGVLSLAAASGADLATTSDIVTDALTAFGMTAADSGKFADVLAAASSNANTNVVMLGESFKYVAPLAGAMGYSAEDVSVALGLMANAGIKGSQAGTSLKTMLANLASPTKQMKSAMDELGISLKNSDGSMKTMDEVMGDLRNSFAGLDETQQSAYASTIFGKEAMAGALSIINASEQDYNKLTEAIGNSEGAAASMAEVMENTLGGKLRALKSATEGVAISFYEQMEPALQQVADWALNAVDKINSLSDGTKNMILVIAGIAAALGPVLIGLGLFTTVIGVAVSGLGMLVSPIGLVIAGIAALGVAFGTAMLKSESFRETVFGAFEVIRNVISSVISTIVPILSTMFDGAKAGVSSFAEGLGGKLLNAFQVVSSVVMTVIEVIGQFVSSIIEGFQSAGGQVNTLSALFLGFNPVLKVAMIVLSEFGPQIAAGFSQIASMAMPLLTLLGETLGQLAAAIIPMVLNVISTLIPIVMQLGMAIMNIITAVLPVLLELFMQLVPVVMSLVQTVIGLVSQLLPLVSVVVDSLVPVLMLLIDTILNIVTAVAPALIAILGAVIAIFQAIIPVVISVLTTVINVVANIISAITPIIAFIASVITTIISIIAPIVTFIAGVIASIFNIITPIISFVTGVFNSVFSIISGVFRSATSFISGSISTISGIISRLSGTVSGVFNRISGIVSSVMGTVNSIITSTFSAIQGAWSGLTGMVSNIFSGISSSVRTLVSQVKGFINGVIGGINAAIGLINKIPGVSISRIPQLYRGTEDWSGGFAYMNEGGRGEMVKLPSGSQVIPHDVSMRYAREAGRASNTDSSNTVATTYNNPTNYFTIDASNVDEINRMIDLFAGLKQTVRKG